MVIEQGRRPDELDGCANNPLLRLVFAAYSFLPENPRESRARRIENAKKLGGTFQQIIPQLQALGAHTDIEGFRFINDIAENSITLWFPEQNCEEIMKLLTEAGFLIQPKVTEKLQTGKLMAIGKLSEMALPVNIIGKLLQEQQVELVHMRHIPTEVKELFETKNTHLSS